MVAGYVVMRIALVGQWLRAAKQDPDRRSACLTYAVVVTVAQIGWIALMLAHTSVVVTFALTVLLVGVETMGPWLAETRKGGTPWHARHIVERYGLLAIIALKARVGLYSDLDPDEVRRAHLEAVSDVSARLRQEVERRGKDVPIAVLPEGPMTSPYLQSSAGEAHVLLAAAGATRLRTRACAST